LRLRRVAEEYDGIEAVIILSVDGTDAKTKDNRKSDRETGTDALFFIVLLPRSSFLIKVYV
jgi:hypothetical protein